MPSGLQTDAMTAEDRGQLLLYFAAHVPGGLQTEDADLLLRLPIFPGIAHTSQTPVWRPLTGEACMPSLRLDTVVSCLMGTYAHDSDLSSNFCKHGNKRPTDLIGYHLLSLRSHVQVQGQCGQMMGLVQMLLCAQMRCCQLCVVTGPACQRRYR